DLTELAQGRCEPVAQELERDRRRELLDELVVRGDHDEAVRGRDDDLLSRMRAAAALDEPARAGDLVGAVDRDVEPVEPLERLDREPESASPLLGLRRGRDAAKIEAAAGEGRQ